MHQCSTNFFLIVKFAIGFQSWLTRSEIYIHSIATSVSADLYSVFQIVVHALHVCIQILASASLRFQKSSGELVTASFLTCRTIQYRHFLRSIFKKKNTTETGTQNHNWHTYVYLIGWTWMESNHWAMYLRVLEKAISAFG